MNQFHQIEISSIHGWATFVPHVPRLICRKVCCCVKNVCVWWWVVGDSELCANSAPVWKHCWVAHTGTGILVEGGQTEKNPGNLPAMFVCVCVSAELANIYSSIIHETKLRCWTFLLVALTLTHTHTHRVIDGEICLWVGVSPFMGWWCRWTVRESGRWNIEPLIGWLDGVQAKYSYQKIHGFFATLSHNV